MGMGSDMDRNTDTYRDTYWYADRATDMDMEWTQTGIRTGTWTGVRGCHTFNTPAPLLQELGLKNKIHTRTAVSWNTRKVMEHTGNHGTHGKSWNTREVMEHTGSLLSVLVAVTHTHPTIPSMFIPPQRLIRPPGCIYAHEIYCMDGSTHDE